MKKLIALASLLALAVATMVAATALADDGDRGPLSSFRATMTGYEEIIPASFDPTRTPAFMGEAGAISTTGHGRFTGRFEAEPEPRIEYRLTWSDLEGLADGGRVLAAHIHFGQRHTVGGVSAFLCGGGGKPACEQAPTGSAEGVITMSDIVGPTAQGIEPGQLDELLRAIANGATYVNLHTTRWPGGEIRGQIRGRFFFRDGD